MVPAVAASGGSNKSPPLPRYNNAAAASLLTGKAGRGGRFGAVQLRPSKTLPLPKLGLNRPWRKTGNLVSPYHMYTGCQTFR